MKSFNYQWNDIIYLLHIQLSKNDAGEYNLKIIRKLKEGKSEIETFTIKKNIQSHRFIISRTHPAENEITIEYPDALILEAFELEDRAYYPAASFYKV